MRTTRLTKPFILFVATLSIAMCFQRCNSSQDRDWVKWNGPFADGTTDEANWNPHSISDISNIIWRSDIGKGHSMVAVKGNLVYVFGNKQIISIGDTADYDIVSCLNSESGSEIWSYKYKSYKGEFPGPCSSPVLDSKYLYTLSRNGDLHCFNATNGEVIWKQQIKEMGYPSPGFGFSCSPVIEDNTLIVKVGESGLALNKKTGEEIWTSDTTRYNSYSSAVLLDKTKNEELLLLNGESLFVLESKTGKRLSTFPWNDAGSDPLVHNNSVFLSNNNEGAILLDLSKNPPEPIWKNDSVKGLFQGFVRQGDYAYGFTNNSANMPLLCVNLKNGKIEWEKDLDRWGSLIVANNKLVIITGKGRLIVAEPTPEKFMEIASSQIFDIPESEFRKNTNCCWTKPVLSHGKIFARTVKGELACIDVSI